MEIKRTSFPAFLFSFLMAVAVAECKAERTKTADHPVDALILFDAEDILCQGHSGLSRESAGIAVSALEQGALKAFCREPLAKSFYDKESHAILIPVGECFEKQAVAAAVAKNSAYFLESRDLGRRRSSAANDGKCVRMFGPGGEGERRRAKLMRSPTPAPVIDGTWATNSDLTTAPTAREGRGTATAASSNADRNYILYDKRGRRIETVKGWDAAMERLGKGYASSYSVDTRGIKFDPLPAVTLPAKENKGERDQLRMRGAPADSKTNGRIIGIYAGKTLVHIATTRPELESWIYGTAAAQKNLDPNTHYSWGDVETIEAREEERRRRAEEARKRMEAQLLKQREQRAQQELAARQAMEVPAVPAPAKTALKDCGSDQKLETDTCLHVENNKCYTYTLQDPTRRPLSPDACARYAPQCADSNDRFTWQSGEVTCYKRVVQPGLLWGSTVKCFSYNPQSANASIEVPVSLCTP